MHSQRLFHGASHDNRRGTRRPNYSRVRPTGCLVLSLPPAVMDAPLLTERCQAVEGRDARGNPGEELWGHLVREPLSTGPCSLEQSNPAGYGEL